MQLMIDEQMLHELDMLWTLSIWKYLQGELACIP